LIRALKLTLVKGLQNSNSPIKYFSAILKDEADDEIIYCGFDEMAEGFKSKFHEGKVYFISIGEVWSKHQQFKAQNDNTQMMKLTIILQEMCLKCSLESIFTLC
jgi:hypothetical protein